MLNTSLLDKKKNYLLGVSGGPDSMALLDMMHEYSICVAHVNYNLRGKDSEKDELFVKELGKKYGIEVSVLLSKKNKIKDTMVAKQEHEDEKKSPAHNKTN